MKAMITRDGFELSPENDGDHLDLAELRKKVAKAPHTISVMAYMHSCTSFWVLPLATSNKKEKHG